MTLDALIRSSGLKKKALADLLGITPNSLSRKLHGKASWTTRDVGLLCQALHIDTFDQVKAIFFADDVH